MNKEENNQDLSKSCLNLEYFDNIPPNIKTQFVTIDTKELLKKYKEMIEIISEKYGIERTLEENEIIYLVVKILEDNPKLVTKIDYTRK